MLPLPHQILASQFDRLFDSQVRSRYFRGLEFAGPKGDAGWFGPDSAVWYVHSHLPTLVFGLFCATYLEGLDPSIVAMGTDHSRVVARGGAAVGAGPVQIDQEGAAVRFGHSLSFFIGTAYGSTATAERLAGTVRAMHHTIKGTRPDGLPYDADDPDWLRWNYATVVWGLASAHERYHYWPLRGRALDRYYAEFTRVGHALGGTDLPATKAETLDCLEAYLPRLAVTAIKAAGTGPNLRELRTNPLNGPFVDWAMRDMLPRWAARMVMYRRPNELELRARRSAMWLALNGVHTAVGPLKEFRQARARVAGGTFARSTQPAPAPDPIRTRAEIEATA